MQAYYIHFKPIPPDGRSLNVHTGKKEAGLSCYEALPVHLQNRHTAWKPAGESWELTRASKKNPKHWLGMIRWHDRSTGIGEGNDVAYLLTGKALPERGGSREPLLVNFNIVCELVCFEEDEELLVEK